jgi:hypothetical protein
VRQALDTPGRLTPDGARCPACRSTVRRRFCSVCGEHAPHRQPRTVWAFLKRGATQLLNADSRLLRSLYVLLFRPGALTDLFLEGHRRHYVSPIKLFAIVNVAFVVVVNVLGGPQTFRNNLYFHMTVESYPHQGIAVRWVSDRIDAPDGWTLDAALQLEDSLRADTSRSSTSAEDAFSTADDDRATADANVTPSAIEALSRYRDYAETFDRQAGRLAETLVFLFIPALAGLFWGGAAAAGTLTGRRGLTSIVQATHLMTALLVLLAVGMWAIVGLWFVAQAAGIGASMASAQSVFIAMLAGAVVLYLTITTRRVEQASWTRAIAQAVALAFAIFLLQRVYTGILFVVAFFVMG